MSDEEFSVPMQSNLPILNTRENNRTENLNEIMATSLKLPLFWTDYPEAWFIHIETLFRTKNITQDNTKYEYLIISLPQDVIVSVLDIIQNPEISDKYLNLKKHLIERHTISEQRKLDKIFSNSELSDQKPSEFYRSLALVAGAGFDNELLKKLWLRKLPKPLNVALTGSNLANITELLKLADNIWEITNDSEICAVQSFSKSSNTQLNLDKAVEGISKIASVMCDQFSKLSMEVCAMKEAFEQRPSKFGYRQHRGRSRSTSRNRNWVCKYHYRYGVNARNCEQPCSFNNNRQHQEN